MRYPDEIEGDKPAEARFRRIHASALAVTGPARATESRDDFFSRVWREMCEQAAAEIAAEERSI